MKSTIWEQAAVYHAIYHAMRTGEFNCLWCPPIFYRKRGKNDLKSRRYTGPAWIYEASGESSKGGVGSL